MKSSLYDIGDVLRIMRKGETVLARVAGFVDSLDDTKPIYVNLRTVDDVQWKRSVVKIQPSQIIELLPTWEVENRARLKARHDGFVDALWAKMTPAEKRRVHKETVALGIAQPERRSPIEILIDRAVGRE